VDTTRPTFTSQPADTTVECSEPDVENLTATDNCGSPTVVYVGQNRTDGPCDNSYTLTRTWKATDACGNEATTSQTITVRDTTPPTLPAAPPPATYECASLVPAAETLTANHACSGTITATATATASDSAPIVDRLAIE
jgi:hypothetical protein